MITEEQAKRIVGMLQLTTVSFPKALEGITKAEEGGLLHEEEAASVRDFLRAEFRRQAGLR